MKTKIEPFLSGDEFWAYAEDDCVLYYDGPCGFFVRKNGKVYYAHQFDERGDPLPEGVEGHPLPGGTKATWIWVSEYLLVEVSEQDITDTKASRVPFRTLLTERGQMYLVVTSHLEHSMYTLDHSDLDPKDLPDPGVCLPTGDPPDEDSGHDAQRS